VVVADALGVPGRELREMRGEALVEDGFDRRLRLEVDEFLRAAGVRDAMDFRRRLAQVAQQRQDLVGLGWVIPAQGGLVEGQLLDDLALSLQLAPAEPGVGAGLEGALRDRRAPDGARIRVDQVPEGVHEHVDDLL
jgi:hypothetical protein